MTQPFLVFDAYGTLLHLDDFVGRLLRGFRARGVDAPRDVMEKAAMLEMIHYADMAIYATDEESMALVQDECAAVLWHSILKEGFDHEMEPDEVAPILKEAVAFRVYPEVTGLLQTLKARGVKMAVASNWDYRLPEVLAAQGLDDFFEWTMCSADNGVQKPDPEFFQVALEGALASGANAGSVCYIGDHYKKDVLASHAAGFTPLWLVRDARDAASGETHEAECDVVRMRTLDDLLALI